MTAADLLEAQMEPEGTIYENLKYGKETRKEEEISSKLRGCFEDLQVAKLLAKEKKEKRKKEKQRKSVPPP